MVELSPELESSPEVIAIKARIAELVAVIQGEHKAHVDELVAMDHVLHEQDCMELQSVDSAKDTRLFQQEPDQWVGVVLGEHLWSKQKAIFRSVRDNRRTAVKSCHEAGKSFLAARIAAHWIESHPPGEAYVVTSAPTGRQVRAILWKEINRAHAKGQLMGRTNQTEWHVVMPDGHEEMVGFGMKPSEYDPAAFQGIHARYVLVIFDEACGMPKSLWTAAEGLIANDEARFLVIGNPDDPKTEFAEVCKPGSGWEVITISAFDTPNFTGEEVPDSLRPLLIGKTWVEERRRKWGESNPIWKSKVLGEFPEDASDGLIPVSWISAAQNRDIVPADDDPVELGVDVGAGGNRNVVAKRKGNHVRIVLRDQQPDTMKSCGNVAAIQKKFGARKVKVDEIGVGKGLTDRGKELRLPFIGINVGRPAKDKDQYANIRAEGYWGLRERFQEGRIDIDPKDMDLAAQLVELKFERSSSGKVIIESKDDMLKRGVESPDDADAVMLCFLPEHLCGPMPVKRREIQWG